MLLRVQANHESQGARLMLAWQHGQDAVNGLICALELERVFSIMTGTLF